MKQSEKCVVLLSGGPDSATVAYWAKNEGYDVYGMTFKYGQIATKEVEYARHIAEKLKIPLKTIDFSSLKDIFAGVTSLCDDSVEMTPTFSPLIIVPFRNAIFLATAVAYAVAINATHIFYGAQGSDEANYPDCRRAFYQAFETAAQLGTDTDIRIDAPFTEVPKAAILKRGAELGVPFHLTWSCYRNGSTHCGRCESCVNRRTAFQDAGLPDPTTYAD